MVQKTSFRNGQIVDVEAKQEQVILRSLILKKEVGIILVK